MAADRRPSFLGRYSRLISLCCAVLVGSAVGIAPPVVDGVYAKKRKKKRGKKSTRSIRKEGELAPKKEYDFDEALGETEDLKLDLDEAERPTLDADDVEGGTAEDLLDEKLDEEIKLARDLIQFETGCEAKSKVEFRLADLYWEKSKRAFFKANDFNVPEKARKRYQTLMGKLQNRTVKHYESIVEDCPGYSDFAKTLYFLGRALIEMEREREGAGYFKRIIDEFPDNDEWVAHAWFMVGEFYFNTENEARKALKAYKKAAEYVDSPIYGFAIYKQGWCYINTADWDLALERFEDTVRLAEDPKIEAKARKALRKEALKDYVRAFSHIGEAKKAYSTFKRIGGGNQVPKMLERLGGWYINRDHHYDVIVVYKDLIKHFKGSTRLPVFQGRIVNAASRLGDTKTTISQAKVLTTYFKKVRTDVKKKGWKGEKLETAKKDLKEAENIAENTMRRLAMDYHKEAKKLRGKAQQKTYQNAYEMYKHYLTVFPKPDPKADVNYIFFMRFYYAEVLFKLEQFKDAALNYDMVVDMNPYPEKKRDKEIVLAAAEESVRAWDELVQDIDRKNPPEISGKDAKPIPPTKQSLITACDRYIKYVGKEGDKIVEIRYKVARIYYTYNHFDRAAPAFNDIVTNHPEHEVACYAANLALDIYNGENNYRGLVDSTRSYLSSDTLACGDEDKAKFAKIEEQAAFKVIKVELEEAKKYVKAGNAYMAYYKRYPTGEFSDDSVYNAAVSYDRGNRLDKANEVRRFLVKTFPNSELVPETLYNIAQSYERVVDFKNAADYLEQFVNKYPDDKRSKDLIYNACLYRATLHEFDSAKRCRNKYISKYRDADDVYKVAYSICTDLEKEAEIMEAQAKAEKKLSERQKAIVKKWTDAHDCYFEWVKKDAYTKGNTDMLCNAQYRRGEIMKDKTKYTKGFTDQKKYLYKMWPNWKKKGVEKVPRCAEAVAGYKFSDIRPGVKKYRGMTISELNPTKKGKAKFDASIKSKVKERDRLIEEYKKIVEIGVAEWALASLFMIGEVYQDSIEKVLKAPIPNKIPGYKLSADDKKALKDQLAGMALPIEELAVEAYRVCVNKSNELGVYNRWSIKALDKLQKLRPEEYPKVMERVPTLAFTDKLTVADNSVVIDDGDTYKLIDQKLKDGVGPPKEKKKDDEKTAEKDKDKDKKDGEGKDEKKGKGKGKKGKKGNPKTAAK